MMRPAALLCGFLLACGHRTAASRPPAGDQGLATHAELAPDDSYQPSYGKAELQRALIAERGAEATGERAVGELEATGDVDSRDLRPAGSAAEARLGSIDKLRVARADLAVRRRFIAALEACEAIGRRCPPRLDEPAWTFDVESDAPPELDAALRFDLEDWQKIAAELHGRACACRTLACVDSVGVAIDQLEPRPIQDVRGDETASLSITRARECLFWLRGAPIAK